MQTLKGTVEAKGEKFNGSVKVEGQYYNFKKGVKHDHIQTGQIVELTLSPWEFNGKSGMNISAARVCDELLNAPAAVLQEPVGHIKAKIAPRTKVVPATDWAAKDRSQLVGGRSHDAAQLVNAALITGTPLKDVLTMYREALAEILKMAEDVK